MRRMNTSDGDIDQIEYRQTLIYARGAIDKRVRLDSNTQRSSGIVASLMMIGMCNVVNICHAFFTIFSDCAVMHERFVRTMRGTPATSPRLAGLSRFWRISRIDRRILRIHGNQYRKRLSNPSGSTEVFEPYNHGLVDFLTF